MMLQQTMFCNRGAKRILSDPRRITTHNLLNKNVISRTANNPAWDLCVTIKVLIDTEKTRLANFHCSKGDLQEMYLLWYMYLIGYRFSARMIPRSRTALSFRAI
jgi:hypothetical protein